MNRAHLFSLLLIFCITLSFAQNAYQDDLNAFIVNQKQEKVYLHFDKPNYGIGDGIWFKAYVVNSTFHTPSETSKILHVDLINSKKDIVESLELPIAEGSAEGHFDIKRQLAEGNYRIRAYTNWMKNFDSDYFFKKDFRIVGVEHTRSDKKTVAKKTFIDFLPEGGDLISDIPSKVAIKITNQFGKAIVSQGIIIDRGGNEVADFKTNDLGHALGFFTPKSGDSYTAIVDGKRYDLPSVKDTGAVIRINHGPKSKKLTIAALSKNMDLTGATLVGHQRGQFLFESVSNTSNSFSIKVDKQALNPGIIHVTLFTKDKVPVSERLVFPILPSDLSMVINSDQESYDTRSRANVELSIADHTVQSASVTINQNQEAVYSEFGDNIINNLLLNSDLKGKIESPGYYFETSREAYFDRDLLMLTHGWSRFDWETIINNKEFNPNFVAEKGPTIKGKVMDYFKTEEARKAKVSLTIPSMGIYDMIGETAENGEFSLITPHFNDSTYIILQAEGFKGKKQKMDKWVKINLMNPTRPDIEGPSDEVLVITPEFQNKVQKLEQINRAYNLDPEAILLSEVVIETKNPFELSYEDRTRLYMNPTHRIILDSLPYSNTFAGTALDLLRTIPGVFVTGNGSTQKATVRGVTSINAGSAPLYLVDGVPVDSAMVPTLPVQMIEFIDVLKGADATIYGARGSDGVIAVYLRKGGPRYENQPPKGLLAFKHPGYVSTRKFYTPQYDIPKEEHSILDYRSTLYWNPNLTFDNGKSTLEFYTSDQSGVYNIRIEGMLKDGTPFFRESELIVE